MNKTRRATLRKLLDELEGIRYALEEVADDEQSAFEDLPEGLQETDRACAMQEAADNLESAVNALEEAVSLVEEAIGG